MHTVPASMARYRPWLKAGLLALAGAVACVRTAGAVSANPTTAHTATLLTNDTILVAGGLLYEGLGGTASYSACSQIVDSQGGVTNTTGNMSVARASHTVTLLPNGMVLAIGGAQAAAHGDRGRRRRGPGP